MTGAIFDLAGSYQAAFLNAIAWNLLDLSLAPLVAFGRPRRKLALA